ncbi:DUF2637 domain-containing protein [Kitasatospora sp. NPDC018058]|uniref:DUF2637 domain-containing protein n=1 Tax=Kitasatospora sp. NPDC018058 TaxID=3364025 RepID=UPI0037BEE30F
MLGLLGFTLSYDALQQMAAAIHVRGPLTYLFPVVVDGFIAYGVRALLVLREAVWTARAYAWLLFIAATGASLWANRLHAVRLNELPQPGGHLRLGDQVVGVLSMVAPLALAGAVHLYILIARHSPNAEPLMGGEPDRQPPATVAEPGVAFVDPSVHRSAGGVRSIPVDQTAVGGARAEDGTELGVLADRSAVRTVELWPVPATAEVVSGAPQADPGTRDHARAVHSVDIGAGEAAGHGPSGQSGQTPSVRPVGRPPGAPTEELVAIGREAWTAAGRLTRDVVRSAIRARNLTVSEDRVTEVVTALRVERDAARDQSA